MLFSRRQSLSLGLGAATTLGFGFLPLRAMAEITGDSYPLASGALVVHPVEHASLLLGTPEMTIYVDPVGGGELYTDLPTPDLILITHEHQDHFDAATLSAITGENTRLITNQAVFDMLPAELAAQASPLALDASTTQGDISILAMPAYNTTEDRLKYHPPGRDNGYVLEIGGQRVYIAGDTEDTPEMRALEGIDIAFVPMNLPYTMTIEQAASGIAAFAPGVVYPYHYGESDIDAFEKLLAETGAATSVARHNWYPGG